MDKTAEIRINDKTLKGKAFAGGVEAGLLTGDMPLLIERSWKSVSQMLWEKIKNDGYLSKQSDKEPEKAPSENFSKADILQRINLFLLSTQASLKEDGVSYDKTTAGEILKKLGSKSLFSKYSMESIAAIANGSAPTETMSPINKIVRLGYTPDYPESKGTIAIQSIDDRHSLCTPFANRFICSAEYASPLTMSVLPDGTFLLVSSVVEIDEKFASGDPQPKGTAIYIFRPDGSMYSVPIPDCYNSNKSFGIDENSFIFADFDVFKNEINIVDVDLSAPVPKVNNISIESKKILSFFGGDAGLRRVLKHKNKNGDTEFFWEVGIAKGDTDIEIKIIKQVVGNGKESFSLYGDRGSSRILLGNNEGAVSFLEFKNQKNSIVFVDDDGKEHRHELNSALSMQSSYTLKTQDGNLSLYETQNGDLPNKLIVDLKINGTKK